MNLWQRFKAFIGNPLVAYARRGPRIAGVHITNDSALQTAVAWACITYLSRTVAQLPWRVLKERADGGADRTPTHPVNILLNRRPNPEMGPFTFKETMIGFACSWGNAVAEIQFDNRFMPVALWPLHPDRVQFRRSADDGRLQYQVDNSEPPFWLNADQVFHVRGFGNGAIGLNVIEYAAGSIGWARATELFGSSYFSEGMRPSGVWKTKAKLSPDAYEGLRKMLRERNGPRRTQEPLIIDGDGDWKQESALPEESQFIQTREHQIDEMCRFFGVPPHKVMHLLRATFSNIEHQSIEVVQDSITPWVLRLEEEADYKLFGANRQGFYTKMDLKGLLRGDFASRTTGYKTLWDMGVLSTNEIRALEDMNPIGPDGDKRIVPLNMGTLKQIGEEPAKPAAPLITTNDEDATPVERARQQRALAMERDIGENARTSAMLAGIQLHAGILADSIRGAAPPQVHVAGSNITIEPQQIDIAAPIVNIAPTAMPAPLVTIERTEVVVHNEAPLAPIVNVAPPMVHMEATVVNVEPPQVVINVEAPNVTIQPAAVTVEAPNVNVESPTVNVAAPSVTVQPAAVTVEAPNVNVESPTVNVAAPNVTVTPKIEANLQQKNSRTEFLRDENGDLVESVTEYQGR